MKGSCVFCCSSCISFNPISYLNSSRVIVHIRNTDIYIFLELNGRCGFLQTWKYKNTFLCFKNSHKNIGTHLVAIPHTLICKLFLQLKKK